MNYRVSFGALSVIAALCIALPAYFVGLEALDGSYSDEVIVNGAKTYPTNLLRAVADFTRWLMPFAILGFLMGLVVWIIDWRAGHWEQSRKVRSGDTPE